MAGRSVVGAAAGPPRLLAPKTHCVKISGHKCTRVALVARRGGAVIRPSASSGKVDPAKFWQDDDDDEAGDGGGSGGSGDGPGGRGDDGFDDSDDGGFGGKAWLLLLVAAGALGLFGVYQKKLKVGPGSKGGLPAQYDRSDRSSLCFVYLSTYNVYRLPPLPRPASLPP